MTFDEYQDATSRTWKFGVDNSREALSYLTMGLTGEAGEVAEYLKKFLYHHKDLPEEDLAGELGDVLWYTARLASVWGYSLGTIAEMNIEKLAARHAA